MPPRVLVKYKNGNMRIYDLSLFNIEPKDITDIIAFVMNLPLYNGSPCFHEIEHLHIFNFMTIWGVKDALIYVNMQMLSHQSFCESVNISSQLKNEMCNGLYIDTDIHIVTADYSKVKATISADAVGQHPYDLYFLNMSHMDTQYELKTIEEIRL